MHIYRIYNGYNYIVLWSIGRITTYIKSYETGNIYQNPYGVAKILEEESTARKALVGSGMRGDKKRTYRLQDDIVIDDSGNKASAKYVLNGNFDILW